MWEWIIVILLTPIIWNVFFKQSNDGMNWMIRHQQATRANIIKDLDQRKMLARLNNCYYDPATNQVDSQRKRDGTYHPLGK